MSRRCRSRSVRHGGRPRGSPLGRRDGAGVAEDRRFHDHGRRCHPSRSFDAAGRTSSRSFHGSTITSAMALSSCAGRPCRSKPPRASGALARPERSFRCPGDRPRDENVVEPAVVVALELHDLAPPGLGPGQPDGGLVGFRARGGEANQLGAGHQLAHPLRQFDLHLVLAGIELTQRQTVGHRLQDRFRRVPQDDGSVGQGVVDEAVAVDIDQPGALAALVEDRDRAFAVAAVAKVAADAAGQVALRRGEEGF